MEDPQYEMDLCVDLINQTVAGIEGIDTGTHLCHAHFDRKHGSEGPYDLIMPALAKDEDRHDLDGITRRRWQAA